MTFTFANRTRYLSCGAMLTLSLGCGGRRFESEPNPLSTTGETQAVSSASSVTDGDAAPTSPDTMAPSPGTETKTLPTDGGVEVVDGSVGEQTHASGSESSTLDGGDVNPSGGVAPDVPSDGSTEPTTSHTENHSATTDTNHASTESSETATPNTTDIIDSTITTITSDTSDTTSASEAPETSNNPEPECNQDERPHDGTCYFFGDGKKDWEGARQSCRGRGQEWDLATINSFAEHEWVTGYLDEDAWLGALETNGKWAWAHSETVFWSGNYDGYSVDDAFTWWEDTEPDGEGAGGQCLRYTDDSGDWAWADMPCSREYQYVCEEANW